MYKSLTGIAAAAILSAVTMPAPANAAPIRNAPGIEHQSNVDTVQYRRHYRGYHGPRRAYRGYYGPRYYGGGPYYYGGGYPAYGPYPYRRYYAPGPSVGFGIGPFGFGVW
jgi:hypothetical protein